MVNLKTLSLMFLSFIIFTSFLFPKKNNKNLSIPFLSEKNSSTFSLILEKGLRTKKQEEINILFGGDLMFDRYIRIVSQKKGNDFIFGNLKNFMIDNDLVVLNLEGPITSYKSISINSEFGSKENYIFTFDKSLVKTLKEHNVFLLNIGNNHIFNFGSKGFLETKKILDEEGISFFGNVGNGNNSEFKILEIKGKKIAFVNYNQFVNDGIERALDDISKVSNRADFIILYSHWGEEYASKANEEIQELAHFFIDNGVDLIIGSHPHVIQQKEIYKDKMIYYSLGNFVFDQYFREDTKRGLLLKVNIHLNDMSLDIREHSISLKENGQTFLLNNFLD